MLQVKNLTVTHKKDLTELVRGLSFVLAPGDRAAIIGEEGNGKSTVLKLLYDSSLVEEYVEWSGEISDRGLRKGYLAQELTAEQLAGSVYDFCSADAAFCEANPRELTRAAQQVGLHAEVFYDDRRIATLSGGERVKLRLALLLLGEPDVLLLDEPSNDLDIETLAWLESFLVNCKVPVLYISHDETLLRNTANMIIHLERLRRRTEPRATVQRGGYDEYTSQRQSAFVQQEQQARKERAEFDAKMEKYTQIRNKVEHQQNSISRQDPHGGRLLKKKMHAVQSLGRRFEREKENMTELPEWEEAILTFFDAKRCALPLGKEVIRFGLDELKAGERVLSRGIRLHVTGPERIGIIGSNGVGKSTLLKLIAAELLSRRDIRAAYMPQDYGDGILGTKTPVEILVPSGAHEDVTRARTLLGSMKYKAEEMEHPSAGLSGGQRAKLLFLSMVLNGSNVLVLDEPTRNFSPLSAPVIRQVLSEFRGCIISVSHDRGYLSEVCDRVLELTPNGLAEVRMD